MDDPTMTGAVSLGGADTDAALWGPFTRAAVPRFRLAIDGLRHMPGVLAVCAWQTRRPEWSRHEIEFRVQPSDGAPVRVYTLHVVDEDWYGSETASGDAWLCGRLVEVVRTHFDLDYDITALPGYR